MVNEDSRDHRKDLERVRCDGGLVNSQRVNKTLDQKGDQQVKLGRVKEMVSCTSGFWRLQLWKIEMGLITEHPWPLLCV